MQVAEYSKFSGLIHAKHAGKRAPMEVSIEVTHRCPLDCLHCYNNLPMGDSAARTSELTLDQHRLLLDQLQDAGCLWLLYTGGEIFGRKDFPEIYKEAKKRGFLITLFTNGTLISPAIADMLAEWRPFAIEITLYGATRETYEALTQIPGSFDRCMRGIQLLKDRGLPLKLKTVPTTVNRHEVYEMKRLAEEELGVEFKFDSLINPRTDCSQSPLAVRLLPEEVVALDYHDRKKQQEYRRLVERDIAESGQAPDSDQIYSCGGGVAGCAIDPTGKMSICVISHQESYDWRQGSFREGWDTFLLQTRSRTRTRVTRCSDCKLRSVCSMCPANGELEAGDPESPVDFLCEVAHLRAYALGLSVPAHGECPYCPGGAGYAGTMESARRIAAKQIDVGSWQPRERNLLPILQSNQGCGASACGSCATH
ncbi:MAG TPA: radical SAM protein [Dongiaceae bacterium]|nr:radical SAM protein [Dongiaceae bacterium]